MNNRNKELYCSRSKCTNYNIYISYGTINSREFVKYQDIFPFDRIT